MPDGSPLIIGQNNTGTATTILDRSGATTTDALDVGNANGSAVYGKTSSSGCGVIGESLDAVPDRQDTAAGVYGTSYGEPGTGDGVNVGVWGDSRWDSGVMGTSDRWSGVEGSSYGNRAFGVRGTAWDATGTGVRGSSSPDAKLYPLGGNSWGILGIGVWGYSQRGTAIFGQISGGPKGIGFAGAFAGHVVVDGNFTVFNGSKSAAVRHPDGSYRRLYALESPESYFEDFGRARLTRGRAQVKLDRDFAALVRHDNYYIFLTPEGDSKGLYVSRRTPTGFAVREQDSGTSNLTFVYRVVARRRDIPRRRLEKVRSLSLPSIKTPSKSESRKQIESLRARAQRNFSIR